MTAGSKHSRTLHATLCEIERELFYATYPSHPFGSDILELPTYKLGTSASHVKQWMEQNIHAFGYATVIWEDAIVLPQSHSPARALATSAKQARPISK
jgi:hypothetical protein